MEKHPLSSRTIWGVIIAATPLIAAGLNAAGVPVSPSELGIVTNQTAVILEAATQIVGLGLAVHGRWRARGPLRTR